MSNILGDSIFWIETEKIKPNPYQPRHEFDSGALRDLAESIRMYGVLQPLVVTRKEVAKPDGGFAVEYELISGERRLRAAKLVGIPTLPVIIRTDADDARIKLELAIIENLQREDLNVVDRARGFDRLAKEFHLKHIEIAAKIGKSREYVSNTLRVLTLPEEMLAALGEGKISEGHTRPLLMLVDRKDEQMTLFKEILVKHITVRESELIARKIAVDRARKPERQFNPEILEFEKKIGESLGTRVHVEHRQNGGKIMIDFFSEDDLKNILAAMTNMKTGAEKGTVSGEASSDALVRSADSAPTTRAPELASPSTEISPALDSDIPMDDRTAEQKKADEESDDLYSVKNFSL